MTVRRLLLARHGQTWHNSERRFTGWADPSLTSRGKAEARALGRRLRDERIDAVYSSDLSRTAETAALAMAKHPASRQGFAVVRDPALREANFGEWQGLTFDEARERDPATAAALLARSIDFCAPGGETIPQVHSRVGDFLNRLHQRHDGDTILVIASGGPLQILVAGLFGMPVEAHWRLALNNCALTTINFVQDEPILTRLNDRCHLEHLYRRDRIAETSAT
jgi:broad specificity phosphatase PhoE